jgi:hypothetical protein
VQVFLKQHLTTVVIDSHFSVEGYFYSPTIVTDNQFFHISVNSGKHSGYESSTLFFLALEP